MENKDLRIAVKKKLERVREVNNELNIQKDRYQEISMELEQLKSIQYGDFKPTQSSGKDLMIARLVRKDNEYIKLMELSEALNLEKENLVNYLKQIENQRYYRVMWHRYILLSSYKEIAERLDLQIQTIKNIINKSINEIVENELKTIKDIQV